MFPYHFTHLLPHESYHGMTHPTVCLKVRTCLQQWSLGQEPSPPGVDWLGIGSVDFGGLVICDSLIHLDSS